MIHQVSGWHFPIPTAKKNHPKRVAFRCRSSRQASQLRVVAALSRFEGLQGFEEEEQHFQTRLGGDANGFYG